MVKVPDLKSLVARKGGAPVVETDEDFPDLATEPRDGADDILEQLRIPVETTLPENVFTSGAAKNVGFRVSEPKGYFFSDVEEYNAKVVSSIKWYADTLHARDMHVHRLATEIDKTRTDITNLRFQMEMLRGKSGKALVNDDGSYVTEAQLEEDPAAALKVQETKYAALQQQMNTAQQTLAQATRDAQTAREELQQMRSYADQMEAHVSTLETLLAQQGEAPDSDNAPNSEEVERLTQALAESEARFTGTLSNAEANALQNADSTAELLSLRQKLAVAQQETTLARAEADPLRARVTATETEMTALRSQLQTTQTALSTAETSLDTAHSELQASRDEAEATVTSLKTAQAQLRSVQNNLQKSQADLIATREQLSTSVNASNIAEELSNERAAHSELQEWAAQVEVSFAELEERAARLEEENEKLRNRPAPAPVAAQDSSLAHELQEERERTEQLQEYATSLEAHIDTLEALFAQTSASEPAAPTSAPEPVSVPPAPQEPVQKAQEPSQAPQEEQKEEQAPARRIPSAPELPEGVYLPSATRKRDSKFAPAAAPGAPLSVTLRPEDL